MSLLWLGIWQLDRAEEKRILIKFMQYQAQRDAIRLDGTQVSLNELRHRQVILSGEYDSDHQFLLDNQMREGKVGVHILTPMRIEGTAVSVLVNRGWVPMSYDRKIKADLGLSAVENKIRGRVNSFPVVGFQIEGAEIPSAGWPSIVQVIDREQLSRVLGYPLLPYQVLLDSRSAGGFNRQWKQSYSVSPDKHVAYAVQWFALAFALLVLVVVRWRCGDGRI